MIKLSIRMAAFILAVFALLLVFMHLQFVQNDNPLGTNEKFNLTILSTASAKDQLVNELNALVDKHDATLVKVVPNQDDYANQRDIVWFGSKEPAGNSPIINDKSISWLEPSVGGKLIHSSNMGVRALYGSYSMLGNAEFKAALREWCSQNEMSLDFYKLQPLPKVFLAYLTQHGTGNAVLISAFLFLTAVIVWFAVHAKARALRLLGGISPKRIHIEDTLSITSLAISGFVAGAAAFFIYLGIASGVDQLLLMLMPAIYTAIVLIIIAAVVVLLLSIFVQPKAKHISFRKIPLKQFKLLGRASLIGSIIFALFVVPSTFTMASEYKAISKDYALWENLKNVVRVSFNRMDGLYTDEGLPKVEMFLEEMAAQDNLCISMAIDRAIMLDDNQMGKYDHIVVTDRSWMEVSGMSAAADNGGLVPIGFENIHSELKDLLSGQLTLWTKTKEAQPEGLGFYEFTGDTFLVLPPNIGEGESTIQANKPLIILVDDAVKTLNVDGFLLPMASSGNVLFKNEAVLREVLNGSPIMEKISQINSVTEGALQYAQLFMRESLYYFAACALCLVSMGAAGIMSAQLWIGENRKRLFTLHTAGHKYSTIIKPVLRKELLTATCATLIGCVIAFSLRHPELKLLLLSAAALFLLYVLLNFIGYTFFSKREFLKMSFRRE